MELTVKNTLPAEIAAVAPVTMEKAGLMVSQANKAAIIDAASLSSAEDLYRSITALAKQISSDRMDITRPIDALKDAVIAAERAATVPLLAAKAKLEPLISGYRKEQERIRAEAERKAREEAEAKARIERQRLEAEQAARIREQEEAAAAAERQAEEERKLFGESSVVVPEVEAAKPIIVVPEVEAQLIPAALPKSAVRETVKKVLQIDDAKGIPIELAGVRLLVPDTKAIDKLLRAGVAVPGCRLVDEKRFGSAG